MKPEDLHWLDTEDGEPSPAEETPAEPEETAEPAPSRSSSPALRILLAALTLMAIAAVIFYVSGAYKSILGEPEPKTLAADRDPVAFPAEGISRVRPFGQMALHLSSNGLQAYDVKNNILWDQPLSMGYPQLLVEGSYASVADLGGNQLLLFDQKGLCQTITTEGTILFSSLSSAGSIAVILDSEDGNTILVFDKNGTLLVRRVTYLEENGIPLSIAINEDSTAIATAYAIFTETTLRSAVTLFNLTDTASDSIDRIAGNYTYEDTLISDLKYMGDELICIGDNRLIGIKASGNTSEDWVETLDHQIDGLAFGENFFAVLLGNGLIGVAGDPTNDFLMIHKDGHHITDKKLNGNRQVLASGDLLVYLDGFDYHCLNVNGTELWNYSAENAMELYPLGENFALGSVGSSMQIYRVTDAKDED